MKARARGGMICKLQCFERILSIVLYTASKVSVSAQSSAFSALESIGDSSMRRLEQLVKKKP